jgi:hypothetical protein
LGNNSLRHFKNFDGKIMSPFLIALVGVIYFCISINSFINGQIGLGISFLGYAIGSIGLYFQAL